MASVTGLSETRASRLARSATRRRRDGSRGVLARRALRCLADAADHGSQAAISAVWWAWQRDPDDELWEVLSRWRDPDLLAEDAFRAAVDPDLPDGERATVARFCARRGLAPCDDIQRAVFYMLTGQAAQHAADDPDGARLAAGYRGAGERTRALLRQAMAGSGKLDLARVLGAHAAAGGAPPLSVAEREYLADQLAARCDWPALWRLALAQPLTQTLQVIQRFGDGWRPDDDRGRALFGVLQHTGPAEIAAASRALTEPVVIRIQTDGVPFSGSFSPDSRQLLLATGWADAHGCQVFDLPDGTLREQHNFSGGVLPPESVLHLGEVFYVLGLREKDDELVRYMAGKPAVLGRTPSRRGWGRIARHPAGLVTQHWRRYTSPEVRIRSPLGKTIRKITVPGELVAADPVTGRLFVTAGGTHGDPGYLIDSDSAGVLGPFSFRLDTGVRQAAFLGPGRLAAAYWDGKAALFRVGSTQPVREAVISRPAHVESFAVLSGEIAAIDNGQLTYLTADRLTPVDEPRRPLRNTRAGEVSSSADGRSLVLLRQGRFADVAMSAGPPVTGLASRPMAAMGPADLAAVRAALGDPLPGPAPRPFLELLHRCLEYRFEADVGLADARPAAAGDDDVGLAGFRPG